MSVCTKYCDKCTFRKFFHNYFRYCDYLLMTGERRPCPAGDGCTVRVNRVVHRKWERTPEERAAFEEIRREKKRIRERAYYAQNKEKLKVKHQKWLENNREHVKEYGREYRKKKKEAKANGCNAE